MPIHAPYLQIVQGECDGHLLLYYTYILSMWYVYGVPVAPAQERFAGAVLLYRTFSSGSGYSIWGGGAGVGEELNEGC